MFGEITAPQSLSEFVHFQVNSIKTNYWKSRGRGPPQWEEATPPAPVHAFCPINIFDAVPPLHSCLAFYESQTMSSARRLVCIFLKSLSKWRLPCALLHDDDGLAELAETKTRPSSAEATASDLLPQTFCVFFTTPFLNSCNAQCRWIDKSSQQITTLIISHYPPVLLCSHT